MKQLVVKEKKQQIVEHFSVKHRVFYIVDCPYFIACSHFLLFCRWSKVVVSREVLEDLLPGPVTVVGERSADLNPRLNPDTDLVGIRIPDHLFMRQLARACGGPVALTSANRSAAQSTLTLDVS